MNKLVIVESPTKARTIAKYLGKPYIVLSSQGHVRDLPRKELGVDVEDDFRPIFRSSRSKVVRQLKKAAEDAESIYLATDNDREGEAIAFDLFTILRRVAKSDDLFARPVFNAITKPIILSALEDPEQIDERKVEAQRTRRILDRLVGYKVSPLLSRIIAGNRFQGLSAGRVQSVALRLLCDREEEISRFKPREYWELEALLEGEGSVVAALTKKDGKKYVVRSNADAEKVADAIRSSGVCVADVSEKERRRRPRAPFITSSLQRRASSKLRFTPKRTMRVAQQLYEGISLPQGDTGLITYMRTDSVRVEEQAIKAARAEVEKTHGKQYLSKKPRRYKNRNRSQDAHEAIRPTSINLSPKVIGKHLSKDQLRLYRLIYDHFLATQMAPAIYIHRNAIFSSGSYTLEASGRSLKFDGFLRLDPPSNTGEDNVPDWLEEGAVLKVGKINKKQKFTDPPRRYSEAGLVTLLEKNGVGRPSTYASIISVIQDRNYVAKVNGSLRPTLLGQQVAEFLKQHFPKTVEAEFTAHMEEDLDRIEQGSLTRVDALNEFYAPLSGQLEQLEQLMDEDSERIFQMLSDAKCDKCAAPMELRYWRGSHFLGCSRYPECKNTVSLPPGIGYSYVDGVLNISDGLEEMSEQSQSDILCPACNSAMEIRNGRYGRYLRCTNTECNETASIPTGVTCPSCGEGALVEKYSRKRNQRFYSCNRYPKCRFAVSDIPQKQCPSCGNGVLIKKGDYLRCSNNNCGHTESQATN